jgi:hypothetical protein
MALKREMLPVRSTREIFCVRLGSRKQRMRRSRSRVGWWLFSARLFSRAAADPLSALRRGLEPQGQSLDSAAHRVRQSDGEECAAVVVCLPADCADTAACCQMTQSRPPRCGPPRSYCITPVGNQFDANDDFHRGPRRRHWRGSMLALPKTPRFLTVPPEWTTLVALFGRLYFV